MFEVGTWVTWRIRDAKMPMLFQVEVVHGDEIGFDYRITLRPDLSIHAYADEIEEAFPEAETIHHA